MPNWDLIRSENKEPQPRSHEEWEHSALLLEEQGLDGFVYGRWQNMLPEAVSARLKKSWLFHWTRNIAYLEELKWLEEECSKRRLTPTVLKGSALLGDIYDDFGQRSMADIDLLVEQKQWDWLVEVLLSRGYVVGDSGIWEGNEFKLELSRLHQGLEIVIELHRRLFLNESQIQWKTVPFGRGSLQKLAPADMLVHLMGHLGYQHTFHHLNWLLDIDLFIRKHGTILDWDRITNLVEALGHKTSSGAVLRTAQKYLGTPVPSQILKKWRGLQGACADRFINDKFLWAPHRHWARYYSVKHLVKDSWKEALKYDVLWVLRGVWKSR